MSDTRNTIGIFLAVLLGASSIFGVGTLTTTEPQVNQSSYQNSIKPPGVHVKMPYTGTNLALPFSAWKEDHVDGWGAGGHMSVFIYDEDATVQHTVGNNSIKVYAHVPGQDDNGMRELDQVYSNNLVYIPINPGDHVYMSAWCKTSASTRGTPDGVRTRGNPVFYFDVHDAPSSFVCSIMGQDYFQLGADSSSGSLNAFAVMNSDWQLLQLDVTIPATAKDGNNVDRVPRYAAFQFMTGANQVPGHGAAENGGDWVQENAVTWWADPIIYINPSSGILATPTVPAPSLSSGSTATTGDAILLNETVSGSSGTPTNTVVFQVSQNSGAWTQVGNVRTLYGGSVSSDPYYLPSAGSYLFRALYSGDGTYTSGTSGSTSLTVTDPPPPPPPPPATYFYVKILSSTGGASNPAASGTPYQYLVGQTASITATEQQPQYTFWHWLLNGTVYTTNHTINITGTANTTYTIQPEFTAATPTYTIIVSQGNGGSTNLATGTHTYNVGTTQTLTATANGGYTFTDWLLNGAFYSSSSTINIVGTANTTYRLQPEFTIITPPASTWMLTVENSTGGTVSPSIGSHSYTALWQTLTATPATNYVFSSWLIDNTTTITSNPYTLTAAFGESHTAKAIFTYTSPSSTPVTTLSAPASPLFDAAMDRIENTPPMDFEGILTSIENRN